jgi:hypothetical protein
VFRGAAGDYKDSRGRMVFGGGRVAGRAPSNGSAGYAGAQASLKLTFQLDHSAGADHLSLAATTAEARAANLIPLPSRLPLVKQHC